MVFFWEYRSRGGHLGQLHALQSCAEIPDRGCIFGVLLDGRHERNGIQPSPAVRLVSVQRIRVAVENLADPGRAGSGHAKQQNDGGPLHILAFMGEERGRGAIHHAASADRSEDMPSTCARNASNISTVQSITE